jgi:hypothetical protein
VVHIRDGREVHDRVAPADAGANGVDVEQVADDRRVRVLRPDEIEDDGLVPGGRQLVDDVRADEARAAGDQDLHDEAARSSGIRDGW